MSCGLKTEDATPLGMNACKVKGPVEAMSCSDNIDCLSNKDSDEALAIRCHHCLGDSEHSANGELVCSCDANESPTDMGSGRDGHLTAG